MSTTIFSCSQPCMLRTASDPLGKCTAHHALDKRGARRLPSTPFVLASQPHRSRASLRCSAGLAPRHDNQPSSPKDAAERRRLLLQYIKDVQPAVMEAFIDQAPPAVVSAMRTTITNMLGTLPPQFFTVTISTLGENLSQLMYSMMMTGYMFRNAQYRLELRGSLGPVVASAFTTSAAAVQSPSPGTSPSSTPFSSSSNSEDSSDDLEQVQLDSSSSSSITSQSSSSSSSLVSISILDETLYAPGVQKSRVQGDVLLWHKENGLETMNAVQYIELLEAEVAALRSQLGAGPSSTLSSSSSSRSRYSNLSQGRQLPASASNSSSSSSSGVGSSPLLPVAPQQQQQQQQQGVMLRGDDLPNELLEYLRGLEPSSLNELTAAATPEVSAAMDAFVGRLMGTHDKEMLRRAGSDCTAQELGKLMFWLMVVGYTLRGMEVRLEMEGALELLPRGGASSGSSTWGRGGGGSGGSGSGL